MPSGAATIDTAAQHRGAAHQRGGRWRRALAACAVACVLVGGTLAIYRGVLPYDFQGWDDLANVPQNPWIRPLTLENLVHFWRKPYLGLWIPVTYDVWAILAHLAAEPATPRQPLGLNPAWFHGANIALHAASAVLVLLVLWRLTGCLHGAALGAALFAWHPMQVEPVSWITGLKDVLSTTLGLAALALYLRGVQSAAPDEQARSSAKTMVLYATATLFFALALLAKPSVVTLPVIAWVLQVGFLRAPWPQGLAVLAIWLMMAGLDTGLNKAQQADTTLDLVPAFGYRPLIAADALAHYACKLVVPVQLGPDYGRSPTFVIDRGRVWWTWLLPVGIAFLVARSRWRREIGVGLAVFVLAVLPVLGLVPFVFQNYSTVADRYAYLGMLGPALIVAAWYRDDMRRWVLLACVAVLGLLALLSYRQTVIWENGETLFRQGLAVNPLSTVSRQNLGFYLQQRGASVEPERLYLEAIALRPDYTEALKTLGNVYYDRGDFAASIERYREAIKHLPTDAEAYFDLGNAQSRLGNFAEAAEAYQKALNGNRYRYDPRVHFNLGIAMSKLGRHAEAADSFVRATQLMPPHLAVSFRFDAHYQAAMELAQSDRRAEAIAMLRAALAIDPSSSAGATAARDKLRELEGAP